MDDNGTGCLLNIEQDGEFFQFSSGVYENTMLHFVDTYIRVRDTGSQQTYSHSQS
jgi:hypothetical protein